MSPVPETDNQSHRQLETSQPEPLSLDKKDSLRLIHFPKTVEDISLAKKRLIYEEGSIFNYNKKFMKNTM